MSLNTVSKQVKYGLISKKPQPQAAVKPRLQAFSRDDSDDEESSAPVNDIARVNAQLAKRSSAIEQTVVSADDPSIYDYDGAYDSFKAPDKITHQLSQNTSSSREPPKSRYVNNLLSTAKLREKEKERVFEKNLLKERKEEDKEFGDKPKFMTAAYKKKLIEDQKWAYEDRLADEVEQRTDVRKSGMEGFYANLLTKNVAMGGNVDAHAVSVYTAGSARQSHLLSEPQVPSKEAPAQQQQPSSSGARADRTHDEDDARMVDVSRRTDSAEQPRKAQRTSVESTVAATPASEPAEATVGVVSADHIVADTSKPIVVVDKKEQILSAKDRYLTRKRALGDTNS